MIIHPVLLCGGVGLRLWPESRPGLPKAFLRLTGARSGLQESVARLAGRPGFADPLVVAGAAHAEVARAQIAALGVPATLVLEPGGRDSAPAIAAAAALLSARDPKGVAAFLASDHFIPDADAFAAALALAAQGAARGRIVTLGMRPTQPSTAFGYIRPGRPIGRGPVRSVAAFAEKPPAELARRYLAEGWLWNSGAFIARLDTLCAELETFAPTVRAASLAAVKRARSEDGEIWLSDAFLAAPRISLDYAVMEKTARAAVLPADFAWSDLGVWDAVREASPKDAAGNAIHGDVVMHLSSGCLIRAAPGVRIVAAGLRDLAIVALPDAVLVSDLTLTAGLKTFLGPAARDPGSEAPTGRRRRLRRLATRRRLRRNAW